MSWQLKKYLNFYRIHLLSFTLSPLIFSAIFWASNGRFRIRFIDSLFICVSAVTGTGLSTIDLSLLTVWQQTILVILELAGSPVTVAWMVVYIRRAFFRHHLAEVISTDAQRVAAMRQAPEENGLSVTPAMRKIGTPMSPLHHRRKVQELTSPHDESHVSNLNGSIACISSGTVAQAGPGRDRDRDATKLAISIPDFETHRMARLDTGEASPAPAELLAALTRRVFPDFHHNLHKTLQSAVTLVKRHAAGTTDTQTAGSRRPKRMRSLSLIATIAKEPYLGGLDHSEVMRLGGAEYHALNSLLWIIPLYYISILGIGIIAVAPYMMAPAWRDVFLPPEQHRKISPIWFSIFQCVNAMSNTGMSIVDQNMVPFRTAYLLIAVLIVCVLAGNTAFPIIFRSILWASMKCLPVQSRMRETLRFLLNHPRRCFIALFPSHQTWLLLWALIIMNIALLLGDLVLNIDNPTTDAIAPASRIALAFLSAAAVRSAGFQGVSIAALTPAVQILYLIMMYIAIYPIAMSVRVTNVYEENTLVIYEDNSMQTDPENSLDSAENRAALWAQRLMRHVRRQLSFDIWWLALSLLLLCIIEREALMNPENATWFNTFAIIFELVSAYTTVGLSLGIPTGNSSFSGAFHTLSKLIICAVMLRGRHRGLPVALDRAVMLPYEFGNEQEGPKEQSSREAVIQSAKDRETSEMSSSSTRVFLADQ